MKYDYDLIVIGGGSGGLTAARLGANLGGKVALLDREKIGGECLYTGCVPSKSLIHAAKIVHAARTAAFGVQPAAVQVDMAQVAAYIQGAIARIHEGEEAFVRGVDLRFGTVTFADAHTLLLDGARLTARNILIATGSHPRVPDIDGLRDTGFLTNETLFDLTHLPPSLIILGGGPMGVEMAQAFARLGSRVTLLQTADRILPKEESEVSAAIHAALEKDGVAIVTGARAQHAEVGADGLKHVTLKHKGQTRTLDAAEIVVTAGREPNVSDLDLDAADIVYDSTRGIHINERLQTTAPPIYAIGDVTGGYVFTHIAGYQAGVAIRNIMTGFAAKTDYRAVSWTTFTDPEASHIGLTEAEARKKHGKVRIVTTDWKEIDRAQTDGETDGFIKLVLSARGDTIYGAHLVGAHSGEMVAEIALAMQHKLGINGILATIHPYPTLSTGVQTAALAAFETAPALATTKRVLKGLRAVQDRLQR